MCSEQPLISIIMPAYNVEKYVGLAINSIINQTYHNWELLVCDDGSIDNTLNEASRFHDPRIKILRNEQNIGYERTCNFLFQKCLGEFITFQDADDLSATNRLEEQLEVFRNNPNLGLCGTGAYIISEKGDILDIINRLESHNDIRKGIKEHNQFIGATIMILKGVLDRVGGYREEFMEWGNQDYDWSYRISELFSCYNIQKPLYYYRQHVFSNSKKITIERAIGPQIVQFLGNQREREGSDFIMNKDINGLNEIIKDLKRPYLLNPSLIYRNHALKRVYIRQYGNAFEVAMMALKRDRTVLKNYTIFVYIFFRWSINLIKRFGNGFPRNTCSVY